MKFDISLETAIERACQSPRNELKRKELQKEKERFVRLWKQFTDKWSCHRLLKSFLATLQEACVWVESETVLSCAEANLGMVSAARSFSIQYPDSQNLDGLKSESRN